MRTKEETPVAATCRACLISPLGREHGRERCSAPRSRAPHGRSSYAGGWDSEARPPTEGGGTSAASTAVSVCSAQRTW